MPGKYQERYIFPQKGCRSLQNPKAYTILNKLKQKHENTPGMKPVFNGDEENAFTSYIEIMSDYGFPLNSADLRYVIKSYLDRTGRNVKVFSNNMPGKDWIKGFLQRHPQLTERFAANIKCSWAAIDEAMLRKYIENLSNVTRDVPPSHIWNLDETNLTDDPGKNRVICRQGAKYPERICNFSKTSSSIMMCGSAAGEILPPYVVYKSGQLWTTWTEGGPKGCRYNHTSSGWFDAVTYSDWFETILLPKLKKLEGKKFVIADNLSTHLNIQIFQMCRENDIHFVCLPPNSTHLTQPLDVAFFHPMKVAWRQVLCEWKQSREGMKCAVLPKHQFPALLKRALDVMQPNVKKNLESGFRKCGIFPCNVEPLLERIGRREVQQDELNTSFMLILQRKETLNIPGEKSHTKRRKIPVSPGKSVSHATGTGSSSTSSGIVEDVSVAAKTTSQKSTDQLGKRRRKQNRHYKTSDDQYTQNSSDEESWDSYRKRCLQELEMEEEEEDSLENFQGPQIKPVNREVGAFVIFYYENHLYPGVIENFNKTGATVSAMTKSKKSWKWPSKPDVLFYEWKDIAGGIAPPKMMNKRGFFHIPELSGVE